MENYMFYTAIAVSANLTSVAIGTETDGSVVCPAGHNGVVGIKPTLGLISRNGIIPIAHSQDTAGPMGRTVKDAIALFTGMVAKDADDAAAIAFPEPVPDYFAGLEEGIAGMKIGVQRDNYGSDADPDVAVRIADPLVTAETNPSAVTAATLGSLEDHTIGAPLMGFPF